LRGLNKKVDISLRKNKTDDIIASPQGELPTLGKMDVAKLTGEKNKKIKLIFG